MVDAEMERNLCVCQLEAAAITECSDCRTHGELRNRHSESRGSASCFPFCLDDGLRKGFDGGIIQFLIEIIGCT